MIEKKKEEQTAEARVADALSKALAEDLGDIPKVSITVEELKALERADRKKRTKRRIRYFSMVAAVVVICVVALYAFWPETAVPVSADKNTENRVEERDGVVVINEGDAEGGGETSLREESWDEVLKYKDNLPELYIPGYVPEGYSFSYSELREHSDLGYDIVFVYKKKEKELFIKYKYLNASGNKVRAIEDENLHMENTNLGKAYILVDENSKLVSTVYLDSGTLSIRGDLEQDEAVEIINKMQKP